MSDYRLNINGKICLGDFSSINDYIELVGENDKLSITLKNKNAEDYDLLCRILQEKKFHVVHDKCGFSMTAYKDGCIKN